MITCTQPMVASRLIPPLSPGQSKHYQCLHCGQVFYRKIPLFDFLLKCPRCNSRRIRTAPYFQY